MTTPPKFKFECKINCAYNQECPSNINNIERCKEYIWSNYSCSINNAYKCNSANIKSLIFISALFLFVTNTIAGSQEASGLSLGKPLETLREPGEIYLAASKGDWNVRCITGNPGETDRCEIQQLLFINDNNPIADISIFKLPAGEIAVAAANVMVPLETLLTKKFRFSFSEESKKEFPYSFCNKNGCLVRMGLLEEDIEDKMLLGHLSV